MIILETSLGLIKIELDFDRTPKTSKNFLDYALESFYVGTLFHRVISGFMIQGGGLDGNMRDKLTKTPIENEANQGSKNVRGSIAMARSDAPHSATSQFFINLKDNNFLDFQQKTPQNWGYCVFGTVIAGMEVVDAIAAVPVKKSGYHESVPETPVVICAVTVDKTVLPEAIEAKHVSGDL